jgi:hypothetical protein
MAKKTQQFPELIYVVKEVEDGDAMFLADTTPELAADQQLVGEYQLKRVMKKIVTSTIIPQ